MKSSLFPQKRQISRGGQACPAGRTPHDLESGVVQVLSLLFSYANVTPIPSPLGKAKEKGADHEVGPDRCYSGLEWFSLLYVLFVSSRLH